MFWVINAEAHHAAYSRMVKHTNKYLVPGTLCRINQCLFSGRSGRKPSGSECSTPLLLPLLPLSRKYGRIHTLRKNDRSHLCVNSIKHSILSKIIAFIYRSPLLCKRKYWIWNGKRPLRLETPPIIYSTTTAQKTSINILRIYSCSTTSNSEQFVPIFCPQNGIAVLHGWMNTALLLVSGILTHRGIPGM